MEEEDAFAERNIKEFINKYGLEGFYELLISNYLFELLMYYLHSERNPTSKQNGSASYKFYIDGRERIISTQELEDFSKKLNNECSKIAKVIVSRLDEEDLLKSLHKKGLFSPKIVKLMEETIDSIIIRE